MGREARCTVHHDGRTAEAKALLETDEVIVRSPFRLRIPLSEISLAVTEGEQLRLEFPGGPALLGLGEKEAARWAHAITHPRSLADKLGVKAGQRVLLVGGVSQELRGDGAEALDGEPADVVFVAVEQPGDLDLLQKLRARIAPDGAIWAVRPKGVPISRRRW